METVTPLGELAHQVWKVVDLAIEHHGHAAVFVEQWLLPG
jgi:hypothetical protein